METETPMNTAEAVAIEGLKREVQALTSNMAALQTPVGTVLTTVSQLQAQFHFYIEQSKEHDVRLSVAERGLMDHAAEIRDSRREAQEARREIAVAREESEKRIAAAKDEAEKRMMASRDEAEKREAAARSRQTTVFTVIQIIAVIVFSLINIYINTAKK